MSFLAKHPIATELLNGMGWYPARPVGVEVGALDVVEGEGEDTNGTAAQVMPSFEGVTGQAWVTHLGVSPLEEAMHSASMLLIQARCPAVQESVTCMPTYARFNCCAC